MPSNDRMKQFVMQVLGIESEIMRNNRNRWTIPGTGEYYRAALNIFKNLANEVLELERLTSEHAGAEDIDAQADKVEGSIRTLAVFTMITSKQVDALIDQLDALRP